MSPAPPWSGASKASPTRHARCKMKTITATATASKSTSASTSCDCNDGYYS